MARSDCVMDGYWHNVEANAETLRGGWLHTGDLGSMDEDGLLTLRDRSIQSCTKRSVSGCSPNLRTPARSMTSCMLKKFLRESNIRPTDSENEAVSSGFDSYMRSLLSGQKANKSN
jgi:acyl-CoA synthetase (AMP-forming)/AMP-acid ligase II